MLAIGVFDRCRLGLEIDGEGGDGVAVGPAQLELMASGVVDREGAIEGR